MLKSTCGAEDGVGKLLEMGQMGRDAKAWPTGNQLAVGTQVRNFSFYLV